MDAGPKGVGARVGHSLAVGNEGAGIVIEAGAAPAAQALLGKTVGLIGGSMYTRYRCLKAATCLELPDGTTPAEGASCFVNPLTALGMVGTMKLEGHSALVHTAAASNLGQMLNKLCLEDGVARCPGDVDVVYANGYGFPRHTGGPLFWADRVVGLPALLAGLRRHGAGRAEAHWAPSPLLEHCVARGETLAAVWASGSWQSKL